MLCKRNEQEIDDYKFYCLTEEDHVKLKKIGVKIKLTHVLMGKNYAFQDILKCLFEGPKPILFLINLVEPYFVNYDQINYKNPDKFCKYDEYTIGRFYNERGNNLLGKDSGIMDINSKLKIYSKISYFHELIFYIREVCKNDIPEDIIKYLLKFI